MERSSEHRDLATALAEARPVPQEDFARELDKHVAAGFPRRSRLGGGLLGSLRDRVRRIAPQRLILAGGGTALAAIAVATVIVTNQAPSSQQPHALLPDWRDVQFESAAPPPSRESAQPSSAASGESESAAANLVPFSRRTHREIERSAEIGLLADPSDVADDSAAVFSAVHDAHGIVLRSTTTSGKRAGARFELLIPSARLGDALAAFSAIDEVRTRHEATEDITAPTVQVSERLQDSRARIDGLLAQLSAAETEAEMVAVEAELDRERRHAADLRAQLDKLERRTDFSHVSLKIESGAATDSGGAWGIGDAFGAAGHILGIAAGVTLVGLAVLAPLTLICLLAWLAQRTWVRAQRRRALRDA